MARRSDPQRLSYPQVYLWWMVLFLILVGFLLAILYREILDAFWANPGLNGLIVFVGVAGIGYTFHQVLRLYREISWVNRFRVGRAEEEPGRRPRLLAPMATLLRDGVDETVLSAVTMRSLLDTVATRLDEARDISRYTTGLLVFLGLLGTFWGLLQTIGSVGDTIQSLEAGSGDAGVMFEDLKAGLEAPLAGMGTAFSSSLFGLTASLIVGFLDLQAGRAQNRFYTELEDWLSTLTDVVEDGGEVQRGAAAPSPELKASIDRLVVALENSQEARGGRSGSQAMAALAEGIQGLVKHLRSEQKLMREWADNQAQQNERIEMLLIRLNDALEQDDGTSRS